MGILSKTGLLASTVRPVQRYYQNNNDVELQTMVKPAPFILKPLAGLYNPYPSACSLLCNHPTPSLSVPVAKNRSIIQTINYKTPHNVDEKCLKSQDSTENFLTNNNTSAVPEELFRKYTETDSRPLTPTPTITSATTNGINRRCLTPQPIQKPKLIVDLRRTHSQETLSWTMYSEQCRSAGAISGASPNGSQNSTPRSVIAKPKASSPKQSSKSPVRSKNPTPRTSISVNAQEKKSPRQEEAINKETNPSEEPTVDLLSVDNKTTDENDEIMREDEEDIPRRRGRRRKRSRQGSTFKTADRDPETQVASIQMDLESSDEETHHFEKKTTDETEEINIPIPNSTHRFSIQISNSFLDSSILKILQRELNQEIIDNEFDLKKKMALEEAQRCSHGKISPAIKIDDVGDFKVDRKLWLTLPRNYSVRDARFELPLDIDEFENLTPLDYLGKYVIVTEKRRLLFNFIFNRFKENLENTNGRFILGKSIVTGLGEVMGRPLTKDQENYIRYLVKWNDEELYDFRTWSSICVLCERLFAHEYWPTNPMDKSGNEMEKVDFETLPRKLLNVKIDPQLKEMLMRIRNG